tara:strand:+ start:1138 stop:1755 length:618 start_codon:yes stop_codon:yes gene_type:complete
VTSVLAIFSTLQFFFLYCLNFDLIFNAIASAHNHAVFQFLIIAKISFFVVSSISFDILSISSPIHLFTLETSNVCFVISASARVHSTFIIFVKNGVYVAVYTRLEVFSSNRSSSFLIAFIPFQVDSRFFNISFSCILNIFSCFFQSSISYLSVLEIFVIQISELYSSVQNFFFEFIEVKLFEIADSMSSVFLAFHSSTTSFSNTT